MENKANNARSFDVKIEGKVLQVDAGILDLAEWAKYTYEVEVKDGELSIDFISNLGDAQLMGLEVFKYLS